METLETLAETRGAVEALRESAAAWRDVPVKDGRWSSDEISDWLDEKADLLARELDGSRP